MTRAVDDVAVDDVSGDRPDESRVRRTPNSESKLVHLITACTARAKRDDGSGCATIGKVAVERARLHALRARAGCSHGGVRLSTMMRDWLCASNADRPLVLTCPLALRMALQEGFTPLVVAAHKGHAAVIDRLIAAGADIESRTQVVHAHKRAHARRRANP